MRRRHEKSLSQWMIAVLAVTGVVGLYIFTRELPALKRYVRIKQM